MVDSGRASKSAINSVINNIEKYTFYVEKELDIIINEVNNLSYEWKDNKYSEFNECVLSLRRSLEYNLNDMKDAQYNLKKKVGLM